MNSSPWSPYNQQSFLSGGSPHLPPSAPHEDPLNNYGGGSSNSLLLSSCHNLQPRTNADPSATSLLPNPNYESLISPKEATEYIFNTCKENQSGIHNFAQLQSSLSRNEGNNFPNSDNHSYSGQVPSISYHSSNMDQPSPGPFGVLPHEAVMPRMNRFDRSNENFISPVSKTATASYNGPYTDRDTTNVYSSAPLSVQSAYSGDTASLSPVVNSVTSSNFSSPSEYYSSPKASFGAYSGMQSPMPQSPSVAQHSYPSSPFTNIDPVNHISVPPCSPMNGGTYVNNMNGVPARNGQKTQHSPSSSAATNVLCYNGPQAQNMAHHGPQSVLSKTPDYHSEYNVYAHEQNSPSSYSSVYTPMHPGQMPNGNNSRLSPRAHSHLNSVPHDPHERRLRYGHASSVPSATISSPNYLQAKVNHETQYGSCSSSIPPGQSMHPPKFPPCPSSMNSRRNSIHPGPSPILSNHVANDRQFVFPSSDMVDDKGALDLFNSHVDSGAHDQDPANSMPNFLDNDLHILGSETVTGRQLRSSRLNEYNSNRTTSLGNSSKNMGHQPMVLNDHLNGDLLAANTKYPYSSSLDQGRPGNSIIGFPRRRGRRGRRRRADVNAGNRWRRGPVPRKDRNVLNNGVLLSEEKNQQPDDVEYYEGTRTRKPYDEMSRPIVNCPPSQPKSGSKISDKKNDDNDKKKTDNQTKCFGPINSTQVIREILSLIRHTLPIRRRTRNTDRRESAYQANYLHFVSFRRVIPNESWPPKREDAPKKEKPPKRPKVPKKVKESDVDVLKIKIKMDPRNPQEWYCCSGTYEFPDSGAGNSTTGSASSSSDTGMLSSQEIKQEIDSEGESNHMNLTGNLSKVTEKKPSAKGKNNDKTASNHFRENHLDYSNNSETLPAGKVKAEKPSVSFNSDEQLNMPKKSGRKAKNTPSQETDTNSLSRNTSNQTSGALTNTSASIKKEAIDGDEAPSERLRSLRSRRNESLSKEPEPGPSVKEEPLLDFSSDHYENFDDTDSDPAWTPSCKTAKAADNGKSLGGQFPSRKRGPKPKRRGTTPNNPAPKRRRGKSQDSRPKKVGPVKSEAGTVKIEVPDSSSKMKKEIVCDRFLVAKADMHLPTPYIWKVDKKSSMLQRFEISEQNGVLLYHSSFTYAARNEISVNNYVTADVRVKSPDTVQYLGPNLSEAAAVALSKIKPVESPSETPTKKENFDHLRDDFTVYIQSLLSQDVDSSFFYEIKKFNDEYFLVPITNLETISERKKEKLLKESWPEELKRCANTYPCVSIVDSQAENATCEVCMINLGNKRLHFHGQPYDWISLGSVEPLVDIKTEFNVCDKCSSSVPLYNRLHHHKYNLFIKCRSKASEVKANNDNLKSHEDVLKLCLEDIAWIEKMFGEQIQIWHEVEEKS